RVIRIKSLSKTTPVAAAAQDIVARCRWIPASQQDEVRSLLAILQSKAVAAEAEYALLQQQRQAFRMAAAAGDDVVTEADRSALLTPALVEQCIEKLYEETPDKVAASRRLFRLAQNVMNVEILIQNEGLVSALIRVLREDSRKSLELATAIALVFDVFAEHAALHATLTQSKIGDLCFKLIDQELGRHDVWKDDVARAAQLAESGEGSAGRQRAYEQELRKFEGMLKKQETFLGILLHLLMNLAASPAIEVKMVKRDIIPYLLHLATRKTPALVMMCVLFLKKLSIFVEAKDVMVARAPELLGMIQRIMDLAPEGAGRHAVWGLLANLCLDPVFLTAFSESKWASTPADAAEQLASHPALLVLYRMSTHPKACQHPVFKELVAPLARAVWTSESPSLFSLALLVNLASDLRHRDAIVAEVPLKAWMKKATTLKDADMFKMLLEHVDKLVRVILKPVSARVLSEVLSLFNQLTLPDFDYLRLLKMYPLLDVLGQVIAASPEGLDPDDDLVLNAVIFLGMVAGDAGVAALFAASPVPTELVALMLRKEGDDEIILQILYCLYRLACFAPSRAMLLAETELPMYLMDLLFDRCAPIRAICGTTLDIIAEHDEAWAARIRQQVFSLHNADWL
ncbi:hypothetical protein CXG81DRAFT_7585, partial [Caulochytrium protostelioides]